MLRGSKTEEPTIRDPRSNYLSIDLDLISVLGFNITPINRHANLCIKPPKTGKVLKGPYGRMKARSLPEFVHTYEH